MKTGFLRNGFLSKLLVLVLLIQVISPSVIYAQLLDPIMSVSTELRVIPTSIELLVVAPAVTIVPEGGVVVPFEATAKYDYPGGVVVPDRDVTNDPLIVWDSSDDNVALVNTIGEATSVSDLNRGAVTVTISAEYGGVVGESELTVIGVVIIDDQPAPASSGGSGWIVERLNEASSPVEEPPTGEGDEQVLPSIDEEPPVEETVDEVLPEEAAPPVVSPDVIPVEGVQLPPTEDGRGGGSSSEEEEEEGFQSVKIAGFPLLGVFAREQIVPLDEAFTQEELVIVPGEEVDIPGVLVIKPEEKGGISRAVVTARIMSGVNLLTLRKSFFDKCFADLENCTSIFSMFSSYDGISLDPKNLVLFPDLEGIKETDIINKAALSNIISGYYGIENSPFLPDKPITRIETLKIIATVLNTLEKGQANYKQQVIDFNALFYQEIYEASLLAGLLDNRTTFNNYVPEAYVPGVRIAHAISQEGWRLIRSEGTPFKDVRPDLYDSHWYYPIVIDKLCRVEMIVCKEGAELGPDESPPLSDVDKYIDFINEYILENGLDVSILGDKDKDNILNIDENIVYLTNPLNADTDGDRLQDGEEINEFETNPNHVDTDYDGLTDGDEVLKYGTDPTLFDTDDDSFSDRVEVEAGSDPLNKNSTPEDKNENRVADAWELEYGIEVLNGSQDTDGDGLADALEYIYGSNPTRIDSDMDGYTDSEEILEYFSDPNDPDDPGELKNLPVLINNFQYGQIVSDPSPLIRGIGPASLGNNVVTIQVLLRNEFGSELMLGKTVTDAKGKFLFVPDIEIKNGTYFLIARSLNGGDVKMSSPLKIIIDDTLKVISATPNRLENAMIDEEVIIKNLVLKVDSEDGSPVLYGTLSEFGSRVNVTWQSLVVSSALIADTTDGSFSVKSPTLQEGRHTVYLQTVRKRDNAVSRTIKVSFDMGLVEAAGISPTIQGGADAFRAAAVGLAGFVSEQSWPFWISVLLVLAVAGAVIYLLFGRNKDKNSRKKK